MLVKKIYLIFFFFLQDIIELIGWFCVGYFFGHVNYAFIKAKKKKSKKRHYRFFFEKYKRQNKMAEKPSLVDKSQIC